MRVPVEARTVGASRNDGEPSERGELIMKEKSVRTIAREYTMLFLLVMAIVLFICMVADLMGVFDTAARLLTQIAYPLF